ncbi:T9SS type A sorting domain-containing protein [Weeksella virosa]|uniref:T9SS type A sorting domain-containing protein n=1 Tax=Weeksella virosa TaxID=1014 RepID=UPI002554129C|nr:T9SS type A sorting domain-containing protein [Weeksella virosa]MDK7374983.1 T9SS type A sorting domain-containing protein [Weeksella virosa]
MKHFYFMNWMIVLMGLISSTALGQNVAYEAHFNNQQGAGGTYRTDLVIELENRNWFASAAYYGNDEFRLGHNKQSNIPSKFNLSGQGSSIEMQWDIENVSDFKIETGKTYGTVSNWYIYESVDEGNSWYSVATGSNIGQIQYSTATPKTARYALVITGSKNPRLVLSNVTILNQIGTPTNEPPVITTEQTTIEGVFGGSLSFAVTANNNPTSWTATNLPQGITFDNGVFSGTFEKAGTFITTVTATNKYGSDQKDFTFKIADEPVLTDCFEEKFDGLGGNNTGTTGSNSTWEGNENFPTVSSAYQAGDAVKLGSSKRAGSITSKVLNNIQGDVSVTFDVKGWTNVEGDILVTLGSQTQTAIYTAKMADNFETVTLHFSDVEANSTITFATSEKRAFLDNISVCNAGGAEPANQTTWDGTAWSNGLPTAQKNVVVSGALEIAQDIEAKSFTIETEGSVTVKTGYNLSVQGVIENKANAAAFVVENNANILQSQDVTNIGEITILRNSTPMVRNDMTLWSAPVTGQGVRAFSPETLFNRFWTFDEANHTYKNIFNTEDAADVNFATGNGYAIRVKNTLASGTEAVHEGKFIGKLNNGTYTVNVSKTGQGFNLIGNPYASSIDGIGFLLNNIDIVNSVHFWTHAHAVGSAEFANNYLTYNRAGGTDLDDLENIASGQGFFVEATHAGSIVFNNEMRTKDAAIFHKNNIERNRIWLSLSSDNKIINNTLLAYMTGATHGIDKQLDAKSITSDMTSLYQVIDNEAYSIQSRSLPFDREDKVALGFNALTAGTYTISIAKTDGLFAEGQAIFLVDNQTETVHNLATPYTFQATEGVNNDRFVVVYENRTMGTNNFFNQAQIAVYNQNNQVVVEAKNNLSSVEVMDVQGRVVYAKNNINEAKHIISTSAKGVMIVKATTKDGQTLTQKVIIK